MITYHKQIFKSWYLKKILIFFIYSLNIIIIIIQLNKSTLITQNRLVNRFYIEIRFEKKFKFAHTFTGRKTYIIWNKFSEPRLDLLI